MEDSAQRELIGSLNLPPGDACIGGMLPRPAECAGCCALHPPLWVARRSLSLKAPAQGIKLSSLPAHLGEADASHDEHAHPEGHERDEEEHIATHPLLLDTRRRLRFEHAPLVLPMRPDPARSAR